MSKAEATYCTNRYLSDEDRRQRRNDETQGWDLGVVRMKELARPVPHWVTPGPAVRHVQVFRHMKLLTIYKHDPVDPVQDVILRSSL